IAEQSILPGILRKADAAAMRDLAGWLQEEQAVVRVRAVDAPPEGIARQSQIVLLGIVAEQRQPEAAASLERAVARTGVASHAAEEAHDVPLKIHLLNIATRLRRQHIGSTCRCRKRGPAKESDAKSQESGHAGSKHPAILQVIVLPYFKPQRAAIR